MATSAPSAYLQNLTDIAMTPEGDLTLGADGDFSFVSGSDAVLQSILFRLKTVQGDWQLQPDCGASLESFIGAANSPQTGTAVTTAISQALTHDGFLTASDYELRVSPLNSNEIIIAIRVTVDADPVIFVGALDLRQGLITF